MQRMRVRSHAESGVLELFIDGRKVEDVKLLHIEITDPADAGNVSYALATGAGADQILLYGTADQESGWQSNIYACDGGVGVMQIMPNTETWMNQRFGTSWKIDTPQDNVMLGGQYLAWAIRYFGEQLGTFDIMGADQTLLNAVISAYNNGAGAVDRSRIKRDELEPYRAAMQKPGAARAAVGW